MNLAQATIDGAYIAAGAAVFGFVVGFGGNLLTDRIRGRGRARQERDAAIAELLTSVVDLVTGLQTAQAAYQGQKGWRVHLLRVALVIAAIGSVLPGEPGTPALRSRKDWQALLDWRLAGPIFDRLLAALHDMDDVQRRTALDLATVLVPRATRFYAAVAVLTLGPDKAIADATWKLTPAVAGLLEADLLKPRDYQRARKRAEKALGEFRAAADKRRR